MVFRDLDPRLVRVLKPMLSLNPSTRATAWQSLQDPIFDEWRGTFKRAPPQISSVMKELAEKVTVCNAFDMHRCGRRLFREWHGVSILTGFPICAG